MDGLMFNEVQPDSMPFLTEFYKNGVHCPQLQPVFPTKTLVNHFSIATGIYRILKFRDCTVQQTEYELRANISNTMGPEYFCVQAHKPVHDSYSTKMDIAPVILNIGTNFDGN